MSYKRPTRTKKHQPNEVDLKATAHMFLLRLVYCVVSHSIPRELVVNMDETGVFLLPLKPRGWAPSGKGQQTVFHGAGDKRQYTVIPTIRKALRRAPPTLNDDDYDDDDDDEDVAPFRFGW
eukprot:9468350-Pyramimonas_sp.AAC.1